MALDNCSEC